MREQKVFLNKTLFTQFTSKRKLGKTDIGECLIPKLRIYFIIFYNYICCDYKLPFLKMKNFTQKFIRLFTLVFTLWFLVNAQCNKTLVLTSQGGENNEAYASYAWFINNLTSLVNKGGVIYYENKTPYTLSSLHSGSLGALIIIEFKSSVEGAFTNVNNIF